MLLTANAHDASAFKRTRAVWKRLLAFVGLAASLAIAAYGQHIIDDKGTLGAGWLLLSSFDSKLTTIYHARQSVAFAIPLFVIAALLFVVSIRALVRHQVGEATVVPPEQFSTSSQRDASRLRAPAFILAVLAAGGWSYLIAQLALGRYQSSYWWLFWSCLLGATVALLIGDRLRKASLMSTLGWRPWEVAFVVALMGLFVGLNVQDLTNWRFAHIGDEGVFWEAGRRIAVGIHDFNFFSQQGPYNYHPVMSSVYQGAVMRVAGVDIFGWKLASTLAIAACLPVFYWLLRTLIGARPSAFGTAILGVSHYLFAYAHTGYNNILALFPTILAFALFFAGLRGRSTLLMFASGLSAGLGFYTFYSGRAAIVILGLVMLLAGLSEWRAGSLRRWSRSVPLPLTVGFIMAVTPIFAVDGWSVIADMQQQSVLSDKSLGAALTTLLYNIPRALLGFNFQLGVAHYVSGSLLDEVTAVLALLGLAYALYRLGHEGYRFLILWFLVAAVVTGVFHFDALNGLMTRYHYALPPMAAFAGLALDRIVAAVSSLSANRKLEATLGIACFAVVLPAILGFNLHRFWVETPKVLETSPAALVFREASSERCDLDGYRSAVFSRDWSYESMRLVFEFYRWDDRMPLRFHYTEPPATYEDAIATNRISCILFVDPDHGRAKPVISRFRQRAKQLGKKLEDKTDISGRTHILVLHLTPAISPAISANPRAANGETPFGLLPAATGLQFFLSSATHWGVGPQELRPVRIAPKTGAEHPTADMGWLRGSGLVDAGRDRCYLRLI